MATSNWLRRISAAIVLAAFSVVVSADGLTPEQVAKISESIRAEMKRQAIPGLSVAVVQGGSLAWSAGFGLSDIENNVAAKASTVYRLGSISKSVTAVAALKLMEQGKFDLDAPVRKYVPEWPEKQPVITIRQLLGHLGGVRHYKGDEIESTKHYASLTDALAIFKDDPLEGDPGTKYSYTTYGFTLLGCAMESASGMRFGELLKSLVWDPAGMSTMRVDEVFAIIPNRAQGYQKGPLGAIQNSGLADTSYKIPGGGLCSTVDDLAKFAAALMNGKLLKPETLKLAWTSQKTSDGKETGYGMGFGVGTRNGFQVISHSGSQQRVATMLLMVPDKKMAVVVMSDLEGSDPTLIARTIAALVSPDLASPPLPITSIIELAYGRT